jgi:hypothetical protein
MDYLYFFETEVGVKKLKWNGNKGNGCCPIPTHPDNNPSWSCDNKTGQWKCHSCGESGNAFTLAKTLGFHSPEQYLNIDLQNPTTPRNGANRPLKKASVASKEQTTELGKLKSKYGSQLPQELVDNFNTYDGYIGMDDDKRLTFHYPSGIKHHKGVNGEKPYWDKASINSTSQIFLEHRLAEYPKDKPLYILEGEKDTMGTMLNCTSFSAGAGAIPKSITPLLDFRTIIIVYDNDDPGNSGATKLADRIKREALHLIVKIAQWDESLPVGYDVYDDCVESAGVELDKAITNAIEYERNIPKKIGVFTIMTGKEASLKEPPPTEWLIENVLPKKFNSCIAGTTGSKKSFWSMQLGMSLANGENYFCGNKIMSGKIRVLYIDTEIGKEEMHRRYKRIQSKMNWTGDDNFIMISKGGTHADIWGDVHELLSYYRPELIIVDSLYNSTTVGDFSKSAQMSKVTDALSDFKERYDVTLLAVAHFNKGQHEQGLLIDRMQGSAVLQNWVEFQMLMISTNVSDFNLWTVAKTRGVRHDTTIIGLQWDDFWFETRGVVEDYKPFLITEHKKNKWQSVLEDCPDTFDSKQWLNVFCSKFNLSERTGRQWLKECSDSPLLEKLGHDKYEKKLRVINEDNIDE